MAPSSRRKGSLVGTADMVQMFGRSRQRVQQYQKKATFPKPAHVLGLGRSTLWWEDEVVAWAEAEGYEITRRDDSK